MRSRGHTLTPEERKTSVRNLRKAQETVRLFMREQCNKDRILDFLAAEIRELEKGYLC